MRSSFGRICVSALVGFGVMGGCGDDGNVNMLPDAPVTDGGIDTPPPAPGMLRLTPTAVTLGSVVVGEASTTMSVTVGNVGMGPTGSISAAISGSMGSNFEIDSNDCNILQPAGTCTITVSFHPSSSGQKAAMLAVTAAPGGTVMAALDGEGIQPGALTISPSTHSFGNIQVGANSTTTTLTVRNTGGVTSGTLTSTKGGSAPGEFIASADTCNGQTLAPQATCTIMVSFNPTTSGSKFANFSVTGTPGGTVTSSVSGVGLNAPQLVANPSSRNFGSVVINTTTNTLDFTILNVGQLPTGALTQALSGTNVNDFTVITSSCAGAVLTALSSCTISVRFNPTTTGAKTAQIDLSAAPGGALTLQLEGTGIDAGQLVIAPSSHPFADTVVGAVSAGQTFTVTNTGGTGSGAIVVSLGGDNPGQFQIGANTCTNASLAPNGTCTISVTFAPNAAGAFDATLFASATPGGTASAALAGNGLPAAVLSITPITKDFGSVGVGGLSAFQPFEIRNVGGTTAGDPTITLGGNNPGQFLVTDDCAGPLLPTQTCTATVRFAPNSIGSHSARVIATSSPGGSVFASLFGQGTNPASLSVNPSSLAFSLETIGDTSAALPFVVTNNGGSATGTLTVGKAGANPGDFNIAGTTCTTLAPGASCIVNVTFQPTARDLRTASISVSGTPGGSVSVGVSGDALPRLEILSIESLPPTNPYDVGELVVDDFTYVDIVLRNNTDADHPLAALVDAGTPAQFYIDDYSCGSSNKKSTAFGVSTPIIDAHDTCLASIRVQPTSEGAKFGQITWSIGPTAFDTANQQFEFTVINGLTITPVTTANFGNVATGATSPMLAFRVSHNPDAGSNTGLINIAALQSQRFALEDPKENNQCQFVSFLEPGESCFIYVSFSPITLGLDQTLLAVSSTPGGQASVNVLGNGVSPNFLIINPDPVEFGDVYAGLSNTMTITVTNPPGAQTSGPIAFNLQNDECNQFTGSGSGGGGDGCYEIVGGTCDYINNTTALAGGQSCTLVVEFDSTGAPDQNCGSSGSCGGIFGQWEAEIAVNAQPGTDGTHFVEMAADVLSVLSITPSSRDFGSVVNETPTQIFIVHNDSPATTTLNGPDLDSFPDSTALEIIDSTCGGTLPADASCSITVRWNNTSTNNLEGYVIVSTTDGYGWDYSEMFGTRTLPTSCLAILGSNPAAGTGTYRIDVDGTGGLPALDVRCDMVTDGGGYTHYLVVEGNTTYSVDDINTCEELGMDVVVPRSRTHALSLIDFYGSQNIVPGIYSTTVEDDSMCPMFHTSPCASNWVAVNGGDWFLNQFSTGEPNDDYNPLCWLGVEGSDADGFLVNDAVATPTQENPNGCFYGRDTYVCSLNDKGGGGID
jgi:hypothetical protein